MRWCPKITWAFWLHLAHHSLKCFCSLPIDSFAFNQYGSSVWIYLFCEREGLGFIGEWPSSSCVNCFAQVLCPNQSVESKQSPMKQTMGFGCRLLIRSGAKKRSFGGPKQKGGGLNDMPNDITTYPWLSYY